MSNHGWITLKLTFDRDEFEALRVSSQREYRQPNDQAHWLVRQALGLEPTQKNNARDQPGKLPDAHT